MSNEKVTIKDVIHSTYSELKAIKIPASIGSNALMELSLPIARAMGNLEACIMAIQEEEAKQAEQNEEPINQPDETLEEGEPDGQ